MITETDENTTGKEPISVSQETIDSLVNSLVYHYGRVGTTTITGCWSFLPNGFQVGYGQASCIDPANYNEDKGNTLALRKCIENSRNKLWELEGYKLKEAQNK